MNNDIRVLWTARLRDPNVKQGRRALTTIRPDGTQEHCCLGVLCVLAVEAGILRTEVDGDKIKYIAVDNDGDFSRTCPPEAALQWAGINRQDENPFPTEWAEGTSIEEDNLSALMELNDSFKFPFDRIADLVDEKM